MTVGESVNEWKLNSGEFSIGYGVSVPLSLGDEEEEETFSGTTGSTTAGVAYVPAAAVVRSKTNAVLRGNKPNRRWGKK